MIIKKNIDDELWLPTKKSPLPLPIKKTGRRIQPQQIIIPNDLLTETLFALNDQQRQALSAGGYGFITERKATKKHSLVRTYFALKSDEDKPLTQFHRAIISAVDSLLLSGFADVSADVIYRAVCGKINTKTSKQNATPIQKKLISDALYLLSHTRLKLDMSEYFEIIKPLPNIPAVTAEPLLKCSRLTGKKSFGGSDTCIGFRLYEPSIFYRIAKAKHQTLTCQPNILDVPNQKNSVDWIGVRLYILQRVLETKAHYKTTYPAISYNDVFAKCRLVMDSAWHREQIGLQIVNFFNHLKECGVIVDFDQHIYPDYGATSIEFSQPQSMLNTP